MGCSPALSGMRASSTLIATRSTLTTAAAAGLAERDDEPGIETLDGLKKHVDRAAEHAGQFNGVDACGIVHVPAIEPSRHFDRSIDDLSVKGLEAGQENVQAHTGKSSSPSASDVTTP